MYINCLKIDAAAMELESEASETVVVGGVASHAPPSLVCLHSTIKIVHINIAIIETKSI